MLSERSAALLSRISLSFCCARLRQTALRQARKLPGRTSRRGSAALSLSPSLRPLLHNVQPGGRSPLFVVSLERPAGLPEQKCGGSLSPFPCVTGQCCASCGTFTPAAFDRSLVVCAISAEAFIFKVAGWGGSLVRPLVSFGPCIRAGLVGGGGSTNSEEFGEASGLS